METVMNIWSRVSNYALGLVMAALAFVAFSGAANAQGADLAAGAQTAATTAVAGGAAVALVILAAVILYRIIKRFSS